MVVNTMQFQQRIESSIKTLETQVGQLASSINHLQSQSFDKLVAQLVVNPKNMCVISRRSEKVINMPLPIDKNHIQQPPNHKVVKEVEVSRKDDQVAAESLVPSKKDIMKKEIDISIPLPFLFHSFKGCSSSQRR